MQLLHKFKKINFSSFRSSVLNNADTLSYSTKIAIKYGFDVSDFVLASINNNLSKTIWDQYYLRKTKK